MQVEKGYRRKGLGKFMMKVLQSSINCRTYNPVYNSGDKLYLCVTQLSVKLSYSVTISIQPKIKISDHNLSGVGDALLESGHVEADGDHLQEGSAPGRVLQESPQV